MRRLLATLGAASAILVSACGGAGPGDGAGESVTVFAAASLADAFTELAEAFEDAHPGVSVETSFAGSSSLREQILAGAPADVYASADESNLATAVEAGAVADVVAFATNRLQIAVPTGNPGDVDGLGDLADDDLLVGLCAPEVPCGALAHEILDAAGVTPAPDTHEPDVRALLTKVAAGELDAGMVYRTDVVAAGGSVEGIDVPEEHSVAATYTIGVVTESTNVERARELVDFVRGPDGQAILREHGFGAP